MRNNVKVLTALMEMPRTSDRKIADKIGISQPTVTRTRHKLVDAGIVKFFAIPDFAKVGYKIITFRLIREKNEGMVCEIREQIQKDKSIIYATKLPRQLFVITVHKDIDDLTLFEARYPLADAITVSTGLMNVLKPLDFTKLDTEAISKLPS